MDNLNCFKIVFTSDRLAKFDNPSNKTMLELKPTLYDLDSVVLLGTFDNLLPHK